MVSWLCSCLGGQQPAGVGFAPGSPEHGGGLHVAVKQVPRKQHASAAGSETHSSDLQDKDQGSAPLQQLQQQEQQQQAERQLSPQRAESSGSGPSTPHGALLWQQEHQRVQTWSPSHVSLDLPGLQQHASVGDLHRQERTLRVLLDKINRFGGSAANHSSLAGRQALPQLNNPELSHIRQQILASCSVQRPGPEVHDRVAQLLQELHTWLVSTPHAGSASSPAGSSAIALLHGAGDALAHAEHLARSAGQVQFWSTAIVRQLVALLRIYTALMDQCVATEVASKGTPGSCWLALVGALVQLLVRPSLVGLLAQVLQLVHLDPQFKATAQRHEAISAAIAALDFLRDVVRLAGTHVEAVGHECLAECLALLAGMLSPSDGLLPRMLQQPLSTDNMAVQLHTLFLLQQLFDAPPNVLQQLLLRPVARQAGAASAAPASAASFYMSYHLTEAARCYFASDGNPTSACAELCLLHVRLLRSLCHGGMTSAAVVGAGPAGRINELLLSELSAQYTASQAAAAQLLAEQADARGSAASVSDASSNDGDSSSGELKQLDSGASVSRGATAPATAAADNERSAATQGKPGEPSNKFKFTYDLNEDLARIIELEEKLGEAVEVNGFEYDQEGKLLLQRSSVMAATAAAEAAKASISQQSMGQAPNSSRPMAMSDGGRPTIPKLSFTSFSRSALSSSRSMVPSTSLAPSAAPSARAMASPARQAPAAASDAVPAVAGRAGAHGEESLARQLLQSHVSLLGSMPGSPLASQRLPSALVTRGSLSRLSLCGQEGGRRRSSPTVAALMTNGGTPFASTAVHFADDDDMREQSTAAAPTVSDPVPAASTRSSTDLPLRPSDDSDTAVAAVSAAGTGSPASRPPAVPALDLSGLGTSSKNARSTRGACSTSGHSRSSRPGSDLNTAVTTGDRRVLDSANDGAGKVNGLRKGGGCASSSAIDAPPPGIAPGAARASLSSVSSAQRSQSHRGPHVPHVAPPAAASTARPSTSASAVSNGSAFAPTGRVMASAPSAASDGANAAAVAVLGDPMQRLLFRDSKLHTSLLALALEASITPSGQLDPAFWQQYPLDNGAQYNLEYLLTWHLHNAGAPMVPELRRRLEAMAVPAAATASTSSSQQARFEGTQAPAPTAVHQALLSTASAASAAQAQLRLLRLLSKAMFDASCYSELKFMARGAYSNVYRAKFRPSPAAAPGAASTATLTTPRPLQSQSQNGFVNQQQQVIIKTIALPASRHDRCVLPDMYGEIAVLEQYQGRPGICQMLDYGLTDDAYWIVMRKYRCSLAEWRQRQSLGPAHAGAATLYLSILLQVVAALKVLAQDSVVHFDLKCSNVLIDPHPGAKDTEIWNPLGTAAAVGAGQQGIASRQASSPPAAPFDAVLADFGEARSYRNADEAFTVRNRGTEVYKSPEMLLLNTRPNTAGTGPAATMAPSTSGPGAAAKAALQGAGLASDVWSLGCLAYELLTGKVLFGGDYASVTHRVAFGGRGNLTLLPAERAALGDRSELAGLLEWVLARDPSSRPTLEAIEARLQAVRAGLWASFTAAGDATSSQSAVADA